MSPSLGSVNLLERLIELRKPIYSLDYQFIARILKDKNQQPDEEIHRARSLTEELLSSWCLGPRTVVHEWFWFPNMETLRTHPFGVLRRLHYIGMID